MESIQFIQEYGVTPNPGAVLRILLTLRNSSDKQQKKFSETNSSRPTDQVYPTLAAVTEHQLAVSLDYYEVIKQFANVKEDEYFLTQVCDPLLLSIIQS